MKNALRLPFVDDLQKNLNHLKKTGRLLIQVIIGPRQVGKTTTIESWASGLKRPPHYVSADAVFSASHDWLIEQWQQARTEKKILIIDEIQKCENWAEIVKMLWDRGQSEKNQIQCILLGSSSLEIQKGLTESLTGRFQLIPAYHWNYQESHEGYRVSFEEFLQKGGYPGSYSFKNKKDWADYVKNSIVATVIEKDILHYNKVKSPALFKQAFDILTSYPAQEISYTKLLGQLQDKGNVELVKYYISLYEGAFLIKALEKFSTKKVLAKASSPKILPLAPALYYLNILDTYSADERGHAFEVVVGAQLVRTKLDLYYWREGQAEVDFILKSGRRIWAIEVKSGRKKSSKGLSVFCEKNPTATPVIITPENYFSFEKNPIGFLESL